MLRQKYYVQIVRRKHVSVFIELLSFLVKINEQPSRHQLIS
jgi:hypothetical protein